jgi:hypothetical protein
MGSPETAKGMDGAELYGVGRKIFSIIPGLQTRQKLYGSGSKITPQAPPEDKKARVTFPVLGLFSSAFIPELVLCLHLPLHPDAFLFLIVISRFGFFSLCCSALVLAT